MGRGLIALVAATSAAFAQSDSDLALLGRVRQHLEPSIAGLPNYTCQEIMERSIRAPDGKIEFRERLRLDVIVTSAGELFSWPGSTGFTADPLRSWIGAGAIGTGDFGIMLRNLLMASAATIRYAGIDSRGQQPLYRFDFHAPGLNSHYIVSVNGRSATTAYSGSLWVNPESLDLVRLETRAEEIPPDLDCRELNDEVSYGRIQLGVADRLLPANAQMVLVHLDGRQSRNAVTFRDCRRYTAETSIAFGTVRAPEQPNAPRPQRRLPAGVTLTLRLEQPISIAESSAGDPIVARLDKTVNAGGLTLPKGTRVLGRIRRLEQHFTPPPSVLAGLEFFAVETAGERVEFSACLIGPRHTPDVIRSVGDAPEIVRGNEGLEIEDAGAGTGIGSFRVRGKNLNLARGFRTVWRTQ